MGQKTLNYFWDLTFTEALEYNSQKYEENKKKLNRKKKKKKKNKKKKKKKKRKKKKKKMKKKLAKLGQKTLNYFWDLPFTEALEYNCRKYEENKKNINRK